MSAHKKSMSLATVTLMAIITEGQAIQKVALENGSAADHEAIRAKAHDPLDIYLDQMAAAAVQVRSILGG